VRDSTTHSRVRRNLLLLLPAAVLSAQDNPDSQDDTRLPNGRKQRDEILKADYEQNLKDAQELTILTRTLEEDLEKDDRWVLSVNSLKKLDDIEKLTKRIRGRMKRI
jgi:hypothetical protein